MSETTTVIPQIPWKPLGKRLVIRRSRDSAVTKGGLFLTESARQEFNYGEVIQTSTDSAFNWVSPGKRLMFTNFAGVPCHEIRLENGEVENYLVVHDDDIIAIEQDTST